MFLVKTNRVIFPFSLDYYFSKEKDKTKGKNCKTCCQVIVKNKALSMHSIILKNAFLELVSKDLKI